jgi:hypothetical protein
VLSLSAKEQRDLTAATATGSAQHGRAH